MTQTPHLPMLEQCAKALCVAETGGPIGYFPNGEPMRNGGNWDEFMPYQHDEWRKLATAVLTTLLNPTPEMIEAGQYVDGTITARAVWQAMIRTALGEG